MADEKVVAPKTNEPAKPAQSAVTPPVQTQTVVIPEPEKETKVEQLQKLTDAKNEPKEVDIDTLIPSEPYGTYPLKTRR